MLKSQSALCLVGALSAALAVVADLALQYTGISAHVGSKEYAYLLDVSSSRLLFGHFAGVVAVLLEIFGFWGVALAFYGRALRLTFFAVSALAFSVGAAFHAMFAAIGLALQFASTSGAGPAFLSGLASAVRPAHEGLGAVTVIGILALSVLLSAAAAFGRTSYPRWMAVLSPLPVILLLALLTRAIPSLRLVLLPAGLNFANLVLFAFAAVVTKGSNASGAAA